MKLVKPGWLAHAGELRASEILSIDASADGVRVATGGLDAKVKVWSAKQIVDPGSESGLLAVLATHNGAVTCVRFSSDGRLLASGSDDRIVLVSERDPTRRPEFGSETATPEAWAPRRRLVGHENDVQDLAWSPDGSLLASVGLDSAVFVWSGTTFEKLRRLDLHQSHVKGIAFDPAGKFFVTCADDRTARIVRYSRASPTEIRFSVEAVITEPFTNSPLTTYFRRPTWSPDGETLVIPNATNGPVPTVAVIDRGRWSLPAEEAVSLVGHEGPCEVARFSPRLYTSKNLALVATAGQDGAMAVWSTADPRPVFVARRVFDRLVSDVSWSPDGLVVYACSLDGSVAAVAFTAEELGGIQPPVIVAERLAKYGQAADLMDIPESAEQIAVAGNVGWNTSTEQQASIETEGPAAAVASTPTVTTESSDQQATGSKDTLTLVSAPSEQHPPKADNEMSGVENTGGVDTSEKPPPVPESSENPFTAPSQPPLRQRVSTTKEGRKRITPVSVVSEWAPPTIPQPPVQQLPQQTQVSQRLSRQQDYDGPSNAVPRGGIAAYVVGNRKRVDSEYSEPKRFRESAEWSRAALADPAATVAAARLGVPRVLSHVVAEGNSSLVLEARNGRQGDPARVTLVEGDDQREIWTDFVAEAVTLVAGTPDWIWTAAAEGGVVYIWTPEGRRLFPPIVLGASVAVLEQQHHFVAVVTATAMLHVWDTRKVRTIVSSVSLAPILDAATRLGDAGVSRAPALTGVRLTNTGSVVVTLNSGNVYTYDIAMAAWQRISEPFWAYASQFWDSAPPNGPAAGPITMAERSTTEETLLKRGARGQQLQRQAVSRMLDGFAAFEDRVSLSHLATRVAAARELKSPEYPDFLDAYVRRLAERGQRGQLGEVLRGLALSDSHLLPQMLKSAANFPAAQQLVVEFQQQQLQ